MRGLDSSQKAARLENLAWLVEADFNEMPDMRLTAAEISRLCNLPERDCDEVLDYLVAVGRLQCDDRYRFHLHSV